VKIALFDVAVVVGELDAVESNQSAVPSADELMAIVGEEKRSSSVWFWSRWHF
jgi:hypothetical protein